MLDWPIALTAKNVRPMTETNFRMILILNFLSAVVADSLLRNSSALESGHDSGQREFCRDGKVQPSCLLEDLKPEASQSRTSISMQPAFTGPYLDESGSGTVRACSKWIERDFEVSRSLD